MNAATRFQILGRETYVSLASFRKSGKEVRTPVWVAPDPVAPDAVAPDAVAPEGERLVVYTNARSGKVKRIRAGSRLRLCACDSRGGLRSEAEWVDARGRMLDDPAERDRALEAIVRKYGWQMRLALLASRLTGRYADRAAIELLPASPDSA